MNARHKGTTLLTFALVASLSLATDALLKGARLHINFSNSVPIGLYREAPEQAGSYAAICLPAETVQHAIHAGLTMEHGTCPGGFEPILKPLFEASKTSPIRYAQNGFSIAGRLLPHTAPKSRSRIGAPLTHAPFGIYRSGLWAISAFNSSSFDSRYFGPVDPGSIQFRVKPFLTF